MLLHKLFVASYAQERNCRILSCWYRCPTTLHQIVPSVPDVCWCFFQAPGTMPHICPRIVPFWDEILRLYDVLVGNKYPNQPQNHDTL